MMNEEDLSRPAPFALRNRAIPMLTRLKINGFKNLVDVDLRFGPFTCIAGANAVGKSNLFDAITFLSALASQPLNEAVLKIRGNQRADLRDLFHRVGDTRADRMSFVAEMLIPPREFNFFGRPTPLEAAFLRYTLELGIREQGVRFPGGGLELIKEELIQINHNEANKNLQFPNSDDLRTNVLPAKKEVRTAPYISTLTEHDSERLILVHSAHGIEGGKIEKVRPSTLDRTILSFALGPDHGARLVAQQEMQSWRMIQLEPSALREPDDFTAPPQMASNGAHLPAALYRLSKSRDSLDEGAAEDEAVYAQIANRLSRLIPDVRGIRIDVDEPRQLLSLLVIDRNRTEHSARALSEGTLRFLALAVLEHDPKVEGLVCLEEPENGIHPARIPALLNLLRGIAVDPNLPVDGTNPLRQVIINTHSPVVVGEVPDDSLVVAESRETIGADGRRFQRASFACLPETWRAEVPSAEIVAKGRLLNYLNPVVPRDLADDEDAETGYRRVVDNPAIRPLLPMADVPE